MTYRDICFCHASNDHYYLLIRILAANVEDTERSEEE